MTAPCHEFPGENVNYGPPSGQPSHTAPQPDSADRPLQRAMPARVRPDYRSQQPETLQFGDVELRLPGSIVMLMEDVRLREV